MLGTDAEGWREGEIGDTVVFGDLADQVLRGGGVIDALAKESVEYRATGVEGLEVVLKIEGIENVAGVADRKL